jgi:hypothetical protein
MIEGGQAWLPPPMLAADLAAGVCDLVTCHLYSTFVTLLYVTKAFFMFSIPMNLHQASLPPPMLAADLAAGACDPLHMCYICYILCLMCAIRYTVIVCSWPGEHIYTVKLSYDILSLLLALALVLTSCYSG